MPLSPVQIRVHDDALERLDKLVSYVETETEVGTTKGRVTRSDAVRLALDIGIEVLERRAQETAVKRIGMERSRRGR